MSIVVIVLNIDNNDFRFSRRRNPRCRPLRKFKVDFLVHRNKVDKIDVYAMLKGVYLSRLRPSARNFALPQESDELRRW